MRDTFPRVVFSPDTIVRRQASHWPGVAAELVQLTRQQPFEYRYDGPFHLLIALHRAERFEGETVIEGVQRSTLREVSRKLSLVPAGQAFRGWQYPRTLTRATCFYIDPSGAGVAPELRFGETELTARLYFDDPALWGTVLKLSAEVERGEPADPVYAEALCAVLLAELVRLERGALPPQADSRGGLAAWQRRLIEEHIAAHLAEPLALSELAELVRLSPRHFVRAFKQSFGEPPHRYHLARRIEQARALLAKPEQSVTEIAVALGFADTSAFSTTFHRLTGEPPRTYRRRLF